MPRILIVAETPDRTTYLDEQVNIAHLQDDHAGNQIMERLVWAVNDAEEAQVVATAMGAIE